MRRLRRTKQLDLSLEIKNDDFIDPPRESQRSWLVNRAVSELVSDLEALDVLSKAFVPGRGLMELRPHDEASLEKSEVMEDWQRPLMKAMAEAARDSRGDVLEVGFGLGVASTYLQELGIRSHTVIECSGTVAEWFHEWRKSYPERDINLVSGLWQDKIADLGEFDVVFFHTYPLSEEEVAEHIVGSVTFAEHFFEAAAAHLRPGGVFTYMSNEIDSLSRAHQRALLRYFDSITVRVLDGLKVPSDTRDTWWADRMALVRAFKKTK